MVSLDEWVPRVNKHVVACHVCRRGAGNRLGFVLVLVIQRVRFTPVILRDSGLLPRLNLNLLPNPLLGSLRVLHSKLSAFLLILETRHKLTIW